MDDILFDSERDFRTEDSIRRISEPQYAKLRKGLKKSLKIEKDARAAILLDIINRLYVDADMLNF